MYNDFLYVMKLSLSSLFPAVFRRASVPHLRQGRQRVHLPPGVRGRHAPVRGSISG